MDRIQEPRGCLGSGAAPHARARRGLQCQCLPPGALQEMLKLQQCESTTPGCNLQGNQLPLKRLQQGEVGLP